MKILSEIEWQFGQTLAIGLSAIVGLSYMASNVASADEGDNRICVGSFNGEAAIVMTSKSKTPHCTRLSIENFNRTGFIDNWTDPTEGDRVKYCDDFTEYHDLTVNVCDVLTEYLPVAWDLFIGSYGEDAASLRSKWFGGEAIGPAGNSGCTSSFLLEKNGTKYVTTAGHCIAAPHTFQPFGGYWSDTNRQWEKQSKIIGPATAFWHFRTPTYVPDHYLGNYFYDVGLIEVVDEKTLRPYSQVFESYRDSGGNYVPGGKVTITDFAEPYVGMQVCMTGMITGTTCGEVLSVSTNSFRATVCATGGDSGAPIYTRDGLAVGILNGYGGKGTSPNCPNEMSAVGATIADLREFGYIIAD